MTSQRPTQNPAEQGRKKKLTMGIRRIFMDEGSIELGAELWVGP